MKWSLRVGRVAGTDIYIHVSFVLAIIYLFLRFGSVATVDIVGSLVSILVSLVIVFGSVLLHELGHSIVAQRFGIPVKSIVLWPLGGFAMLGRQPEKPMHELLIAGAGPLVNIVLALAAWAVGMALSMVSIFGMSGASMASSFGSGLTVMMTTAGTLIWLMVGTNAILALFNLLPAYPLDGGRMLKAGLTILAGENRANQITAGLSSVWGIIIIALGFFLGDWIMILVGIVVMLTSSLLPTQVQTPVNLGLAYLLDRGAYHIQKGENDRAIEYYNGVLERTPDNWKALQNRGYAHMQQQNYDQALADFDRGVQLQPDSAMAYTNRGLAHYRMENWHYSEADNHRAIELDPTTAMAYNNLAVLMLKRGEIQQALEMCNQAIQLETNQAPLYETRAQVYHALGQYDQSIADCNQAIERLPDYAGYYFVRGSALYARGEHVLALVECERIVQQALPVALIEQDLSPMIINNLEWTRTYYTRIIEQRPDDALAYRGRGDAYRVNGYIDQAITDYDNALRLDPTLAEAYIGRGHAYGQKLALVQAVSDLEQAQAQTTLPLLRQQAALLLRTLGVA
jgi:Zn-dependent protease/Tfp pilus assembly protein PilF